MQIATVLLCHFKGAIGGGESYGDRESNTALTYIACGGMEPNLVNCSFNTSAIGINCGLIKDAHVVCQGM